HRDYDRARHRDDEGIDGRRRLHAPEPRETGDLRRAAPDDRVLHRAHVPAGADHSGYDRDAAHHGGAAQRRAVALMSLRAFHLFSIALSVVLAAFFAAWAASQYRAEHALGYAVAAVAALLAGGGLVFYGAAFQRKTRHLVALLILLAAPRAAYA